MDELPHEPCQWSDVQCHKNQIHLSGS
jgi:hypothetical protein